MGRRRKLILLAVCSPFLLPLFCLVCPLISLAALFLRLTPKARRHRRRYQDGEAATGTTFDRWILQQYLEDQLSLVRSVYDCGDECDDDDDGCEGGGENLKDERDGFLSP
ncbi:uncharacterized protein [Aristolochia californica]|uniref:uncharacterized protein n=1 Tax=Aristolochia californica TaxID=171875 RepID=UPI0035DBE128